MTGPEQAYREYAQALARCQEAHRIWEALTQPINLGLGPEAMPVTEQQLRAERQVAEAWQVYIQKRDAYQAVKRREWPITATR